MSDPQIPEPKSTQKSSPPSEPPKIPSAGGGFSSGPHYPNPPESVNPDAATLRDQWRFAIRQYSKWYSHAWGTAILAGLSFFALGWVIKGSNPLPSFKADGKNGNNSSSSSSGGKDKAAAEVHQPR
ncbi:Polyvinyl alcohol dehydrogenase (cytochrome) [Handroanthus impetiginosus]|uniref:Polyvinyl alcohol dehydrogenase (Cytochrome) n=1 Tax=Handroanthus impetiginosus TaxID=429701 RepID=A0A2G9GYR9_9LAMI|nr:Polyvinyl alcohol dehydrogenase (cytochrome) [Handroanthus impetiginosus]